jgi:hypothetical protein
MPRAKTPRATTTTRTKLATPQFRNEEQSRQDPANDTVVDLRAEISRRAYELYQERGCVPGFEQEDWIVAEREVLARYSLQAV